MVSLLQQKASLRRTLWKIYLSVRFYPRCGPSQQVFCQNPATRGEIFTRSRSKVNIPLFLQTVIFVPVELFMRLPPFALVVILCGVAIAATQLAAERSSAIDPAAPAVDDAQVSNQQS
ncbi:hypothetical protein AB9K34_03815 [Sedimentitalea sp. XS_ASV28]|uniref:hypothetical protein n=1 Tax=Sedimentitalea sp. XS_ASV28 TaxID=3241296 RepID=UPI003513EA8D